MQNLHRIHLDALLLSICQFNFQGPQKWSKLSPPLQGLSERDSCIGGVPHHAFTSGEVSFFSSVETQASTSSRVFLRPILVIHLIICISNREFKKLLFTSVHRVNM